MSITSRTRTGLVALATVAASAAVVVAPAHNVVANAATTGLNRTYISASYGNFTGGQAYMRKGRYTLTPTSATTGRVTDTFAQWSQPPAGSGTMINNRFTFPDTVGCNGVANCTMYGQHANTTATWTGTYTFSGSNNAGTLVFSFPNGAVERWQLSQVPNHPVSKMALVGITYPRGPVPSTSAGESAGYASTQPWSVSKSAAQVDGMNVQFPGAERTISYNPSTRKYTVSTSPWTLNIGALHRTNSSRAMTEQSGTGGTPGLYCGQVRKDGNGKVIGLPADGNVINVMPVGGDRLVYQDNWHRCLQGPTGSYSGGLHINMLDEVIDDGGTFVGLVGIQANANPYDASWYLGVYNRVQA